MKTIDVKSMLIGFLLCAGGFLFMGQTDNNVQTLPQTKLLVYEERPAGTLPTTQSQLYDYNECKEKKTTCGGKLDKGKGLDEGEKVKFRSIETMNAQGWETKNIIRNGWSTYVLFTR